MKIKFNWGTGIVIVTLIFMVISVGTTLFFMNQDVELVHNNYYERELNYQQQVSKLKKTAELQADVNISVESNSLLLAYPAKYVKDKTEGQIFLYRASSSKKDYTIDVRPDTSGTQVISTSGMNKGLWKVQVAWSSGANEFYTEKNIMVY